MTYQMERGKKRLDYLKELKGILPERNKEFITYLMYGSFRRVQTVFTEDEKFIRVEKRSPKGYFSTIEAAFDKSHDDLPAILLKECENVLLSTKELQREFERSGMSESEIKERITLIRLLASKLKDDINKFNKFY